MSKNSTSNPNCGGKTNYKRFFYAGVAMDSSWEVELAKFLDSKSIKWERSKKMVLWWTDNDGKKRRYHPDFWIPSMNCYLEPKNKYLMTKDAVKLQRVVAENNVKIIFGSLEEIISKL
jgi:hypothetical protein